MDNSLEVIPALTLDRQVLDRLREAILAGHFPPEVQLNQVQIAAMFGVSRGPVRAALSKLEEEGLVRNIPHRGTFVTPLEKEHVYELYGVRATLEAYGTRLAVNRCTQADIERFIEIVDAMGEAARQGDTDEVIRLDFMVHELFMEMSGNKVLLQTWSTLKIQVRRALSFRHHSYPDLEEIADSHLPFIELMKDQRGDEAAVIMETHIHEACTDLMKRWDLANSRKESIE